MRTLKLFYLPLILLCFITLVACSSNPQPKPAALVSFSPKFTPKILWTNKIGSSIAAKYLKFKPAFSGNIIFAAGNNGIIKAIDIQTGKTIWQVNTKTKLNTGLTANNTMLFTATENGQILALNQTTGKIIWKADLPSEILANPAADNNKVVVKTTDGQLTAFAANTGKKLWGYTNQTPALILRSSSAPKISGNLVISGFADGEILAIDLNSGSLIWQQQLATPEGHSTVDRMVDIDADPIIFSTKIYAAAFQGNLGAIELKTGQVLWRHNISCYNDFTVTDKSIYITDAQNSVWALNRSNGAIIWQQPNLQNRGVSAPVKFYNTVVVGDIEGYLHFMDAKTGNFVARLKLDNSGITTQPVVYKNHLYIITRKGNIMKLLI